ncbi:methionyl-tRNA formyltransferase [Sulfuriferula plumbiphila]|uniref:Methionyl-tRNA formyltransferase n=1 Tax=Sulfuriferula plumbiphila TaxID=171865 RepID=A0A512L3C4_9PROT|nr:methionyl-tRNA formyltransferase [Sulfuriferula plumbiphila]BBP02675.1 methionyl-tRNA formyltransferase [Sulfuriferula plumbiphila]GEP28969.1 methionyl-tRNA formyltransferase [Sulfuriferula plumbiphila]
MHIIFAGTPEFARVALTALHAAGNTVVSVLTQPDRPAGRGMKLKPSAVKQEALRLGLPVLQPVSLKAPGIQDTLRALDAELMVVAAYGLILPQAVLDIPRRGCLNIHASLLPRWRGAAPIQRAILAGDTETGITIMQMDAGLDTGAMLRRDAIPIAQDDTSASLHDKLAMLGGRAIVTVLDQMSKGPLKATPQPDEGACYAAKIGKAEAALDFTRPATELARAVRAYNPAPGAATRLHGTPFKVWSAHATDHRGTPGRVITADAQGILVACGTGALCLTEVQPAGGKRQSASRFLAGHALPFGTPFGN